MTHSMKCFHDVFHEATMTIDTYHREPYIENRHFNMLMYAEFGRVYLGIHIENIVRRMSLNVHF